MLVGAHELAIFVVHAHIYACACRQDLKALHDREARKAKLERARQAMHKQQLASVPAPFKSVKQVKAGHLTLGEKHLLDVAQKEIAGEQKKALSTKKQEIQAEALREKMQAAKKTKPAAKAHKTHKAAVKHALHKVGIAMPAKEDRYSMIVIYI
jgi:hypothetical protein